MLPHLYECDFDEIFIWLREAKQISRRWQYSWIVKYALNNDKVPEQHLDWALSSLSFSTLSESARTQHAKKALGLMSWNYKHLSQCDRVTYSDYIDLLSTPMLVAFHPKRYTLSGDEWKELLEADLRALRFTPSHIVKDKQVFDDEYLLELLHENNVGHFYRPKYKLVSFINQLAPERLSVEFCEKIKAGGFAEQHHLVVATKLKTKKKG